MKKLFSFIVLLFLTGCTSGLQVQPTIPPASRISGSPAKIGIFVTKGPEYNLKPGSGIWLGTTYNFTPSEVIANDLAAITKRRFKNAGLAENAGDKRWDYVLEYSCEKPLVSQSDLECKAPMKFVLRNPQTGREIQSNTLVGEGSAGGGRIWRIFFGRLAEKGDLEETLDEAYTSLYGMVDNNLARTGAEITQPPPQKPYRRRE